MIAAANVILEIARKGVVPATYPRRLREFPEADKAEKVEPKKLDIPILVVNPNFTRISAVEPDGTEFTAEIKSGDVVDVEPTELDVAD